MPYLIDANVFIQAKNLLYGLDFCPAYWDWLVRGNTSGQVFSIEKVGDEIAIVRALGAVGAWATQQSYEPAAVSTFLQVADCYLVAHALAHGHTLATQRRAERAGSKRDERLQRQIRIRRR